MRTAWNLLKPYKKRLAVILLLMLVTAGGSTIGVALGITMLATMISALQVLALQPKKILSMMS